MKKNPVSRLLIIIILLVFGSVGVVSAQANPCNADINQDTVVDLSDYSLLAANLLKPSNQVTNQRADINRDGVVDLSDYSILAANLLKPLGGCSAPTPNPTPTQSPQPSSSPVSSEWTQFAGNAQRTSYTPTEIPTPWRYKWQFNGAGSNGKTQAGHLSVPDLVQPITGGNRIYYIAGGTLYALGKADGQVIWSRNNLGTLSASPAYLSEYVYQPSEDGRIYKLNAATGATLSSFTGNGAFATAVLIANNQLVAGTRTGNVYAINPATMAQVWSYSAGSAIVTPASYSQSKNRLIVNTQDLYVHAINANNGSLAWRVKPTSRNYQSGTPNSSGAQFEESWPVVADQHGIVFVRYRLDWDTLWTWNPYPTTNSAIRANLTSNPNVQTLYALNLDTGSVAFIPAVGNGGAGDGGTLPMGPQPIIRQVNNQEVAYIVFRNGLTCQAGWCDGREDAAMGEMVLDNSTVPGYVAGDMRFIKYQDIQTDEMMNITMSGNIIFHSHWLINSAEKITDRSNSLGATFINPIKTTPAPYVIWRQVYCPPSDTQCNPQFFPGGSGTSYGPSNCPFNAITRYCASGLYSYGDQRGYPAGFYQYHNDRSSGTTPFTIVSDGMVLVKTNDGGLIALENGSPTASTNNQPQLATISQPASILGAESPQRISYIQATQHLGKNVTVSGTIASVVNNRPKAMYLGFTDPHDGNLLLRVFEQDLAKFNYDLSSLLGKRIEVTGFITLYWPDNIDPEIRITDPSQIKIIN